MTTYRPIMRLLKAAGVSVFLLVILSITAAAQTNKGEIVGTVKDANGAVVPGASVTITKVDTGAERKVTSGDAGEYNAPLLDIGTYKVAASKQGFQTTTNDNVILQTNDRLRVDLELKPGTLAALSQSWQPRRWWTLSPAIVAQS